MEKNFTTIDYEPEVYAELQHKISIFLSSKAATTQRTYIGIIAEWCGFLGVEPGKGEGAKAILNASDFNAIEFNRWLKKQPGEKPRLGGGKATLSNATITKKLAALRQIYRVLISAKLYQRGNPFDIDKVPNPKVSIGRKRITEMIDFSDVSRMIEICDSTPKGIRDKALLSIFFGAGLRKGEVLKLAIEDVRQNEKGTPYLFLRETKVGKDEKQSLADWVAANIVAWLRIRKEQEGKDTDPLFTAFRGRGGIYPTPNRLSRSGLDKAFKRYVELVGANRFATPHSARATAVTKMLCDGEPPQRVQQFLRSRSLSSVERHNKMNLSLEENPGRHINYGNEDE